MNPELAIEILVLGLMLIAAFLLGAWANRPRGKR